MCPACASRRRGRRRYTPQARRTRESLRPTAGTSPPHPAGEAHAEPPTAGDTINGGTPSLPRQRRDAVVTVDGGTPSLLSMPPLLL